MSRYRISLDVKMHYDVEKESIEEAEERAMEAVQEGQTDDDVEVYGYEVEKVSEGDSK